MKVQQDKTNFGKIQPPTFLRHDTERRENERIGEGLYIQTHRQQDDVLIHLMFFQNTETKLKPQIFIRSEYTAWS
jgi:hypothetical protein